MKLSISLFLLFALLTGCLPEEQDDFHISSFSYDFRQSSYGWLPEFANYPDTSNLDRDSIYQWTTEYTSELPPYLGLQPALKLSCFNVSGDIFMFMKKKIIGLRPLTRYHIAFEVELATNALTGQGIVLKAGGSAAEPQKVLKNGRYVLDIDTPGEYNSGGNLVVMGDIGMSAPVLDYAQIVLENSNSPQRFICQSNEHGELWLIVGSESGYVGVTTVYYREISVVLSTTN